MSILSRLFGSKKTADAPSVDAEIYEGFRIVPEPIKEGGQFRIAARIEKVVGGQSRMHHLIRADTMGDFDQAAKASVAKAKQMIDEQGDRIFNDR